MVGKKLTNKKRKMDIEEEPKQETVVVDVNVLVNDWLKAQSEICTVLLNIVNKITALEKKLI